MNMRDAHTGELQWASEKSQHFLRGTTEARLPANILSCRAVSREINFSSVEPIHNFRLVQRVLFHGNCIEEWRFQFGFVIPGSTNSWQQVIEAADEMLPAESMSGNITIETNFFDDEDFLASSRVVLFYE